MHNPQAPTPDKDTVPSQLRGETVAYAVQTGAYNLVANFFEPYINYHIQKHYSGADKINKGVHGSYVQNLLGEFSGDVIGAGTLIAAETLIPNQLHDCTGAIRKAIDPIYTSVAHRVFASEKGTPDYEQKVEEWKLYHERNFARSAIMATAGLAGNVALQKTLINNPSPTKVIFAGKLASTALTTALGLTARFAFPEKMQNVDTWMSRNIFMPYLSDSDRQADGNTRHTEMLDRQRSEAAKQKSGIGV